MKEPKLIRITYSYDDGTEKVHEGRGLKKYNDVMGTVAALVYSHKRSWGIPDFPKPKIIQKKIYGSNLLPQNAQKEITAK